MDINMKRKVVIDTGALYRLGHEKEALKMLKKCGCKYYDITLFWKGVVEHIGVGDDYREKAKELREFADSLNMKCEQAHAYFTNGTSEEVMNTRIYNISKEIEIASIMGAKGIVIHPIIEYSFNQNIEFIKKFIPLAHKFKIKLLIENIWGRDEKGEPAPMCTSTPKDFVRFIDTLNDKYVAACLDIGHAEMSNMHTSAPEMIHALGRRLQALHIHDNNRYHDQHQVPYTNQIDFEKILIALKEEGYKGNVTFEVETCYQNNDMHLPFELYPAFIKLELEIGKYFASFLDS